MMKNFLLPLKRYEAPRADARGIFSFFGGIRRSSNSHSSSDLHPRFSAKADKNNSSGGQLLIELTLAIGLTAILLPALLTGFIASREGKADEGERIQATAMLREMTEAVRSVRELSWSQIDKMPGDYHPQLAGSSWSLADDLETTAEGFTKKVAVSNVSRDITSGQIVDNGAPNSAPDPSTKKLVLSVSWNDVIPSSIDSTVYLTRYLENQVVTQTTETEFDQGMLYDGAITTNIEGGEVSLGAAGPGHGNWCQPAFMIQPGGGNGVDLPRNGAARAVTAIVGEAFAGTGLNSSGVSLAHLAITNTNPPVVTVNGTFNGYKTNDVFGEPGYAYLGTDDNQEEVVIVSTATSTKVARFNIQPNAQATSLFVLNNIGYVLAGNRLRTFSTVKPLPANLPSLGSVTLPAAGTSVYVVGSYAYVTVNSTTDQLRIYQISPDGKTLTFRGSSTVNGQAGRDVYVSPDGNRAYLVTAASATQPEFFIINTQNKTAPVLVTANAFYDTNGMDPKAVDMVLSGNRAIIVGTGGEEYEEYQVVDIRGVESVPPSAPIRCGGLDVPLDVYDVATVTESDGDAYAYIVTGDTSSEFKIIEGGPGGQLATSGYFESSTLPQPALTADASFNRFDATFDQPGDSRVRFQVAVANQADCGLGIFNFVGLNGDPGQYFSDDAAIPLNYDGSGYENPGRCFRYRVYLYPSSDYLSSPTFKEMSINYTP